MKNIKPGSIYGHKIKEKERPDFSENEIWGTNSPEKKRKNIKRETGHISKASLNLMHTSRVRKTC